MLFTDQFKRKSSHLKLYVLCYVLYKWDGNEVKYEVGDLEFDSVLMAGAWHRVFSTGGGN